MNPEVCPKVNRKLGPAQSLESEIPNSQTYCSMLSLPSISLEMMGPLEELLEKPRATFHFHTPMVTWWTLKPVFLQQPRHNRNPTVFQVMTLRSWIVAMGSYLVSQPPLSLFLICPPHHHKNISFLNHVKTSLITLLPTEKKS